MPLPLRLTILIALVLLAAVLITARLNYAKFVQVTEALDNSRYALLARDLKATLEAGLDLGLSLDQIQNAQKIVERQRARYPEILAISVFDEQGHVLFSSGQADSGLLGDLRQTPLVSGTVEDERIAATTLVNPFGAVVGGVEIRVSAQDAARRNETMLAVLGKAVLGAALLGTAAVGVIAVFLLRGVRRRLAGQAEVIASIGHASSAGAVAAGGFHKAANDALAELGAVERLVEKTRSGS